MQADDGEEASRVTTKLTDSGFEISELRSVCRGVDTTGLAASLPTLPVGLSCHGRSSPDVIKAKLELRHNTGRERVLIVLIHLSEARKFGSRARGEFTVWCDKTFVPAGGCVCAWDACSDS